MRTPRFLPTAVELCLAPGGKEAEYTRFRRLVERRTRLLREGSGRVSHRTESGSHIRPAIVGQPSPEMAQSTFFRPSGGVPRRVGEDLTIAVSPLWSPNGKSILVFGVQGRIMSDRGLTAVDWFIVDLAFREIEIDGRRRGTSFPELDTCRVQHRHAAPDAVSNRLD